MVCGGALNAKTRLIGRVCLLPTALIIRVGGKLLCQLFFGGKWLLGWELWGFWRAEGLDTAILLGFLRKENAGVGWG